MQQQGGDIHAAALRPFCPGISFRFTLSIVRMENCLDLAIRTAGAAGSVAPTRLYARSLLHFLSRYGVCLIAAENEELTIHNALGGFGANRRIIYCGRRARSGLHEADR